MALSELQLVIFGDSYTDGGYRGHGIIGAEGGSHDPMEEVLCGPMRKISEDVGSKYHFKELGYYEGCASDGLTWPYHVGVKKVLNFACSSATSCQYVEKYVEVPPGYVAMPASECLVGHRYHPRGVAQQIQWAAKILPQEIWSDTKTWVIIGTLSNDVFYHREKGNWIYNFRSFKMSICTKPSPDVGRFKRSWSELWSYCGSWFALFGSFTWSFRYGSWLVPYAARGGA